MKVEWGKWHLEKEFNTLIEKTCGYKCDLTTGECFSNKLEWIWHFWLLPLGPAHVAMMIKTENRTFFRLDGDSQNLFIDVFGEKHLKAAQKFARAYEKKTGKKVRILRQY